MDQPSIGILANRTSNCHTEMNYFRNRSCVDPSFFSVRRKKLFPFANNTLEYAMFLVKEAKREAEIKDNLLKG